MNREKNRFKGSKVAMVSNLLVVLCGEHETQPVVNTRTLDT